MKTCSGFGGSPTPNTAPSLRHPVFILLGPANPFLSGFGGSPTPNTAPLLSPVYEHRTPSRTAQRRSDSLRPQAHTNGVHPLMNGERAKDHGALAGGLPSIQGRPCKKRSWVEDTLAAGKLDKYGRVNDKTPAKWRPARGKKALRPDCQLRHDPVVSRRHLLSIFVRSRWPKKDLIVNEILVMREGKHETSGRPNRGLTALDNSHSSLIFISAFLLKNYSGLLLKNYKMELELELGGDIDGHNKFVTPLPASLDSQCASLDIWKMQPYDIPAVETTYSSHPDSAYGSPQNVGRLPMSPTEKDLSVLDALHPASFDSQGVSHYIARECYFCSLSPIQISSRHEWTVCQQESTVSRQQTESVIATCAQFKSALQAAQYRHKTVLSKPSTRSSLLFEQRTTFSATRRRRKTHLEAQRMSDLAPYAIDTAWRLTNSRSSLWPAQSKSIQQVSLPLPSPMRLTKSSALRNMNSPHVSLKE